MNSTSTQVTCRISNKQCCVHRCDGQYIPDHNDPCIRHRLWWRSIYGNTTAHLRLILSQGATQSMGPTMWQENAGDWLFHTHTTHIPHPYPAAYPKYTHPHCRTHTTLIYPYPYKACRDCIQNLVLHVSCVTCIHPCVIVAKEKGPLTPPNNDAATRSCNGSV